MEIKPKTQPKRQYKFNKQKLTCAEVDFLKTRLGLVLSEFEQKLQAMKDQINLYKQAEDKISLYEWYLIYKDYYKAKLEQSKIAKIQYKLKRGLC